MNRWGGSKEVSEAQASSRDQRAARRHLASNPQYLLGTDSLNNSFYEDCNSSLINVDGTDDSMTAAEQAAAAARALMAAELAKPFEEQDFDDDSEAWKKSLSLKFDRNDVLFWFSESEVSIT